MQTYTRKLMAMLLCFVMILSTAPLTAVATGMDSGRSLGDSITGSDALPNGTPTTPSDAPGEIGTLLLSPQNTPQSGNVCEIVETSVQYNDLSAALADVTNNQTIRLLQDINYSTMIKIEYKTVTFDLNGFDLNVETDSGAGLYVLDGEALLNDSSGGEFNVKSTDTDNSEEENGCGVYADGGKATVTNAVGVYGVNANNGGVVTVHGSISVADTGTGSYDQGVSAVHAVDNNSPVSTKPQYLEYTNGALPPAYVWVRNPSALQPEVTFTALGGVNTNKPTDLVFKADYPSLLAGYDFDSVRITNPVGSGYNLYPNDGVLYDGGTGTVTIGASMFGNHGGSPFISGTYTAVITFVDPTDPTVYFDYSVTFTLSNAAIYLLTVEGGTGGGDYVAGAQVTITADAAQSGKVFDKWTGGDGGAFADDNNITTTFTMPGNAATVTATYKDITYPLSVVGGTGGGDYAVGTQVTATANTAPSGQRFKEWTATGLTGVTLTNNPLIFNMPDNDVALTATYEPIPAVLHTLTVVDGTGSGSYAAGDSVTATANTAPSGQRFKEWTATGLTGVTLTGNPLTFSMPDNDVTLTATYEPIPAVLHTLTVVDGTGSGSYAAGEQVTISANTPPSGKAFDRWTSGNGGTFANANSATAIFTMPEGAATVTATYRNRIIDTGKNASWIFEGDYDQLDEIRLNNTPLQQTPTSLKSTNLGGYGDYGPDPLGHAEEGSVKVTLYKEFLRTLPGGTYTLTVRFKDGTFGELDFVIQTYPLTVVDGTGSGNYAAGAQVPISANTPPSDKAFDIWTSGNGGAFDNANSATAIFTMPEGAVTVTATYRNRIIDTGKNASWTFEGDYDQLDEIRLNNVPLRQTPTSPKSANLGGYGGYGPDPLGHAEEGSVKVTLYKEFLRTLPGGTYTLTVMFKDGTFGELDFVIQTYPLTVENGIGSGNFAESAQMTITANTAPSGKVFDRWTGGNDGSFANAYSATTTFTMPGNAATVTATYKDGSGGGGASSSGGGVRIPPSTSTDNIIVNTISVPYSKASGLLTSNVTGQTFRNIVDKAYKDENGSKTVKLSYNGISGSASLTSLTLTLDAGSLKADEDVTFIIETPFGVFIYTTAQMLEWFDSGFGTYTITLEKSSLRVEVKKGGQSATWNKLTPMAQIGVLDTLRTGESTANLAVTDKNGRILPTSVYEKGMVYADIFALGTYKAVAATPATFYDTAGHWAKTSIDYVTIRKLISGTTSTTFVPDTAITRTDFLMALGKLSGANVSGYKTSSFTDVANTSATFPYIEWAVKNNIVTGIGGGKFAPDSPITREQIALMMANYGAALGYALPVVNNAAVYADSASINAWAKDAVTAMQKADIMTGKDGNRFDPQGSTTRAEAATILRRFVGHVISSRTAEGWSNANTDLTKRIYYNQNGNALIGWQTIGDDRYHFGSDGIMRTDWLDIDDKQYYFYADGKLVAGKWAEISGKWYYFNPDGTLAVNTSIDGYEVGADGVRK